LVHQFVTEIDGVCENLSIGASVALDDNAIQSQKYTSIGKFQLFWKIFAGESHFKSLDSYAGLVDRPRIDSTGGTMGATGGGWGGRL
jgi:hypothetical protein